MCFSMPLKGPQSYNMNKNLPLFFLCILVMCLLMLPKSFQKRSLFHNVDSTAVHSKHGTVHTACNRNGTVHTEPSKTRRGRPCWYQTLHWLAPPIHPPQTKIVPSYMWHVTCNTWHMTHDTWHMTGGVMSTFSQNISSLAFTVWEGRCSEDLEEKGDKS